MCIRHLEKIFSIDKIVPVDILPPVFWQIQYKQKIWLEKYFTKSLTNHFDEIKFGGSRIMLYNKFAIGRLRKFGDLHKKSPIAKFNSMSNFLLIRYYMYYNAIYPGVFYGSHTLLVNPYY